MKKRFLFAAVLLAGTIVLGVNAHSENAQLEALDPYTLVGPKNFLTGYQPLNGDGSIHVVIEIPAGTLAKWEVDKSDGKLRWEFKKGKPRVVKYLGYPGNYGMVPRTLLPKKLGGDGDPLDVLVLGPAVPRGTVVKVSIIGVLKLLDGGEQDDKLLAVAEGTAMAGVRDLRELNEKFPGVGTIVETWFVNYKGPGELVSLGFGNAKEAERILRASIDAFKLGPAESPATSTSSK